MIIALRVCVSSTFMQASGGGKGGRYPHGELPTDLALSWPPEFPDSKLPAIKQCAMLRGKSRECNFENVLFLMN